MLVATSLALMLQLEPGCGGSYEAKASKLPAAADRAWEVMGGGPSDLFFPEPFLGQWDVSSVLVSVETPLGDEFVTNKAAVERSIKQDLNREER